MPTTFPEQIRSHNLLFELIRLNRNYYFVKEKLPTSFKIHFNLNPLFALLLQEK